MALTICPFCQGCTGDTSEYCRECSMPQPYRFKPPLPVAVAKPQVARDVMSDIIDATPVKESKKGRWISDENFFGLLVVGMVLGYSLTILAQRFLPHF